MGKFFDEYLRKYESTVISAIKKAKSDENVQVTEFPIWAASVCIKRIAAEDPISPTFLNCLSMLKEIDPEMARVLLVGLHKMQGIVSVEE